MKNLIELKKKILPELSTVSMQFWQALALTDFNHKYCVKYDVLFVAANKMLKYTTVMVIMTAIVQQNGVANAQIMSWEEWTRL